MNEKPKQWKITTGTCDVCGEQKTIEIEFDVDLEKDTWTAVSGTCLECLQARNSDSSDSQSE